MFSHPRFYWGETGTVLTRPLFSLPVPSSRATVPTGYGFVLPDENGWSRYLHFQAAWVVVVTGLLYAGWSLFAGHFQRELLPARRDLAWRTLREAVAGHLRRPFPSAPAAGRYNVLQRLAYVLVICVLFPLVIWSGLAMSPAVVAAFPFTVNAFGGQQSARTIHFFVSIALVVFLMIHVGMIWRAGFKERMRAMITGKTAHIG